MNFIKNFIISCAKRLHKISWIYETIKFFVHLVPPLEKKIVGILYPGSVPVFKSYDCDDSDIMSEYGRFVYEKIKFMTVKK